MKLPDNPLRAAVRTALTSSAIIYQGKPVTVHDSLAPDTAKTPYVILDNQQSLPDDTKDTFGFSHVITLRVVHAASGTPAGRSVVEAVTELVLARITPTAPGEIPFSVAGWHLWDVTLEGKDLVLATDKQTVYQKILTITYNLQQTT